MEVVPWTPSLPGPSTICNCLLWTTSPVFLWLWIDWTTQKHVFQSSGLSPFMQHAQCGKILYILPAASVHLMSTLAKWGEKSINLSMEKKNISTLDHSILEPRRPGTLWAAQCFSSWLFNESTNCLFDRISDNPFVCLCLLPIQDWEGQEYWEVQIQHDGVSNLQFLNTSHAAKNIFPYDWNCLLLLFRDSLQLLTSTISWSPTFFFAVV